MEALNRGIATSLLVVFQLFPIPNPPCGSFEKHFIEKKPLVLRGSCRSRWSDLLGQTPDRWKVCPSFWNQKSPFAWQPSLVLICSQFVIICPQPSSCACAGCDWQRFLANSISLKLTHATLRQMACIHLMLQKTMNTHKNTNTNTCHTKNDT